MICLSLVGFLLNFLCSYQALLTCTFCHSGSSMVCSISLLDMFLAWLFAGFHNLGHGVLGSGYCKAGSDNTCGCNGVASLMSSACFCACFVIYCILYIICGILHPQALYICCTIILAPQQIVCIYMACLTEYYELLRKPFALCYNVCSL